MPQKRILLGVFAHPDDESFGPGGTLARYAAEGADVHVIIATDGIAGSVEESHKLEEHEILAQVRSTELANAAVALGITSIWSLPYRDSGMRGTADNEHPDALIQQPLDKLVENLVEYIERLQPQVILTHDPFGGYGHPDHIRCCESVTAAFHLARERAQGVNSNSSNGAGSKGGNSGDGYRGPQKLYYTAFDKRLVRVFVKLMPYFGQDPTAMGRNKDINWQEIAEWEMPITTRIDARDYYQARLAASRAHASQFGGGGGWMRMVPKFVRNGMIGYDHFSRAFPEAEPYVEQDLFAGVS
jgi:LmbE family N-acetylglucosaminyl deacetylase